MRRIWDITLTAAITAVVTTLINNAIADESAAGRTWTWLQVAFLAFADRAAPVLAVGASALAVLWLAVRLVLLSTRQHADALEVDARLPNPLTVVACSALLLLAAALSLAGAANGSDVAAVVACCVGVVSLRSAGRLIDNVRRTVFATPL